MNISQLRAETAADHRAVEGTILLLREELHQAEYVVCLDRLHGFVAAWEEDAARMAPAWLAGILAARQRKEMLERDLTWFRNRPHAPQHPINFSRPILPPLEDETSLLGAMYVMEGSTLGGQLIARHVTRVLGLSDGNGDAFFRGHGDQTGTLWKEFCGVLQARVPDAETDAAIRSAKAMFQVFGSWMQGAPA